MIRVCWICHSECAYKDNALNQKNQSPCNCKGSLESVHRECLNSWVTKRYKKILNEINVIDIQKMEEKDFHSPTHPVMQKLTIHCPNCKYPFKYEVIELPQEYTFKSIFSHNLKEKIILLVLIVFQLGLLALDYFKNEQVTIEDDSDKFNEQIKDKTEKNLDLSIQPSSNNKQGYDLMNILYLITVIIILIAAGYNIFDSKTNFGIQVKDKDYLDNFTLNLRQNLKQ